MRCRLRDRTSDCRHGRCISKRKYCAREVKQTQIEAKKRHSNHGATAVPESLAIKGYEDDERHLPSRATTWRTHPRAYFYSWHGIHGTVFGTAGKHVGFAKTPFTDADSN